MGRNPREIAAFREVANCCASSHRKLRIVPRLTAQAESRGVGEILAVVLGLGVAVAVAVALGVCVTVGVGIGAHGLSRQLKISVEAMGMPLMS